MIGIKEIGVYIPSRARDNFDLAKRFGKDENFVKNRLGGQSLPIMEPGMETSDMACRALDNLLEKVNLSKNDIDCLVVCTQNPDGDGLPHTSAIVQKKAGLSQNVAAFDISLGCSGYVYGLKVVQGFMMAAGLQTGVFVTADPYSKIVNEADANTVMLFGDAATATLMTSDNPVFVLGRSLYATDGEGAQHLITQNGQLYMNGRAVFNFVATKAVKQILHLLKNADLTVDDVDYFILHQGSRYIIDTIASRLRAKDKVIFYMETTGNTVSSSVPLILEKILFKKEAKKIVISGFGVGFSMGSMILEQSN